MSSIGRAVQDLVIGIILAAVLLLVGVALGPTIIDAAAQINATTLGSTPMATVIVLLATYIGFFYYLGIVLGAIAIVWGTVQRAR